MIQRPSNGDDRKQVYVILIKTIHFHGKLFSSVTKISGGDINWFTLDTLWNIFIVIEPIFIKTHFSQSNTVWTVYTRKTNVGNNSSIVLKTRQYTSYLISINLYVSNRLRKSCPALFSFD